MTRIGLGLSADHVEMYQNQSNIYFVITILTIKVEVGTF